MKMMARPAAVPSGAISKTINMAREIEMSKTS